jgi:CheY-like chemotaxis protein
MKRDMDLIREILLYAEEHCPETRIRKTTINFDGVPGRTMDFHVKLLCDANMLETATHVTDGESYICSLTWKGYEFLDKIRDDKQWRQIKGILAKTGDFSFETVSQAASSLIAEQLKTYATHGIVILLAYLFGLFVKPFWK